MPAGPFRLSRDYQARCFAARQRWTIRTDPARNFVKCFDRNANVAFAPNVADAVWGLWGALEHVREINHALIRIMIEKRKDERLI